MTDRATDPIHVVVAGSLRQRTGGYLYDARMVDGLRARGRIVEVLEIAGSWPDADDAGRRDLAERLAGLPDGALVVVDGLVGGAVPDLLVPHARRLRLLPLVHHPLCDELRGTTAGRSEAGRRQAGRLEAREARTLALGRGVIVTSDFTAERVAQMGVDGAQVRVVEPGTERPRAPDAPDAREVATRSDMGPPMLLCVGSVVPRKGQLDLVRALATLVDLPWRCEIVGSLGRDAGYAEAVRAAVADHGLEERVTLLGELGPADLEAAWSRADLFVLPSRYEGYGMAFTEALVRGLPVLGTTGGAIPYTVPPDVGRLVDPDDEDALAAALRELGEDGDRREDLARRARAHAAELPTWPTQVARFESAIDELSGRRGSGDTFPSDWLALREPADHAARAEELAHRVAELGTERGWSRVLDLGTGRGSNLRWLAPRLTWARSWVALDHDATLLAELREAWRAPDPADRAGLPTGELRVVEGDLADPGLAEVAGADLVTASALLDLVSEAWVRDLAVACADRGAAALVALSWDGTATLDPSDAVADEVLTAFRAHQLGEKGMGAALGPSAPEVAARAFAEVGMEVRTASTPWRLGGVADGPLMLELVRGWVDAACEVAPERAPAFRAWLAERTDALAAGDAAIEVGHVDLLAVPVTDPT